MSGGSLVEVLADAMGLRHDGVLGASDEGYVLSVLEALDEAGYRIALADTIVPIPLRADVTVYIQGLPPDLTTAEADKIKAVIMALAVLDENMG